MTARSNIQGKAPLLGTVAILVSGLTLLVAAGPAVAADLAAARPGVAGAAVFVPAADHQGADAS